MENNFVWTDELVAEFHNWIPKQPHSFSVDYSCLIDTFKKSKEPKKDYEIVSFQRITNGDVEWVLNESGNYTNINSKCAGFSFNRLYGIGYEHEKNVCTVLNGQIRIYSVRRLSDGEVFTVGDKVRYAGELCHYDNFVIDNFFINKNKCLARDNDNGICEWITEIKKVKEPLFTASDGVEIYKGDKFYPVAIEEGMGYIPFSFIPQRWGTLPNQSESFRYFSTKEAAKDYVIMNKPCLSLNDVKENIKSICDGTYKDIENWEFSHINNQPEELFLRFKELVKSKL